HGPLALPPPAGVRCVPVVSAADMLAACRRAWPRHDVLIMAAAVADYAPRRRGRAKRKKSSGPLNLELEQTADVLAELASGARPEQVVIGFALEDRAARRNAQAKLRRKRLDAIVLNAPAAMSADASAVEILTRGEPWRVVRRQAKPRVAS